MSNRALEISERNELVTLIKRVSAHFGGDDQDWLKDYATEIVKDKERTSALFCFRELGIQCGLRISKLNA